MRFHKQKSYPYPVIRDFHDDYINEHFFVKTKSILGLNDIELTIDYDLSSKAIHREIKSGNAVFMTVLSCRDTFYHKVFTFDKPSKNFIGVSHELLSGKVLVESFGYITKDTSISSSSINDEYLPVNSGSKSSFEYKKGSVIAQAQAHSFEIQLDLYKPLGSIFTIEVDKTMEKGQWTIFSDTDKVIIAVAKDIKQVETDLSADSEGSSTLLNSIYYAAVMHLVQMIKDDESGSIIESHLWAKKIDERMTLKEINIETEEAYSITTKILDFPFLRLSREDK